MAKIKYPYPLTIIADRYDGAYSGGRFLAFNLHHDQIPPAVTGDDVACAMFWHDQMVKGLTVGVGESPEKAIRILMARISNQTCTTDTPKNPTDCKEPGEGSYQKREIRKFLDTPVTKLPISQTSRKALLREYYLTVEDILGTFRGQLSRTYRFSNDSLNKLETFLKENSIRLGYKFFYGCLYDESNRKADEWWYGLSSNLKKNIAIAEDPIPFKNKTLSPEEPDRWWKERIFKHPDNYDIWRKYRLTRKVPCLIP